MPKDFHRLSPGPVSLHILFLYRNKPTEKVDDQNKLRFFLSSGGIILQKNDDLRQLILNEQCKKACTLGNNRNNNDTLVCFHSHSQLSLSNDFFGRKKGLR